jgi:hypothetical protein
MLITSEMMAKGELPLVFTGGACNIQGPTGPLRNPGRDPLAAWLVEMGWDFFDPQIHPSTHGREYVWAIDGPQEKVARDVAQLRVYEIIPTTISAVSILEIMDDAYRGRKSIVWFNGGSNFEPIGLGKYAALKANHELKAEAGDLAFSHLLAYVNAGRHIRKEMQVFLAGCPHILFVYSLDELKSAIEVLLAEPV